jgi:hypothetical protein
MLETREAIRLVRGVWLNLLRSSINFELLPPESRRRQVITGAKSSADVVAPLKRKDEGDEA